MLSTLHPMSSQPYDNIKKQNTASTSCVHQVNELLACNLTTNSLRQASLNGLCLLSHASRLVAVNNFHQRQAKLFSFDSGSRLTRAPDADTEELDARCEVVGVDPDGKDYLRNAGAFSMSVNTFLELKFLVKRHT